MGEANRENTVSDHDRVSQEAYNLHIDTLRQTGRITQVEADWYKYHYNVDKGWSPPVLLDEDDYDYQSTIGDVPSRTS
jgi:hypothetical protein